MTPGERLPLAGEGVRLQLHSHVQPCWDGAPERQGPSLPRPQALSPVRLPLTLRAHLARAVTSASAPPSRQLSCPRPPPAQRDRDRCPLVSSTLPKRNPNTHYFPGSIILPSTQLPTHTHHFSPPFPSLPSPSPLQSPHLSGDHHHLLSSPQPSP